MLKKAALFLSFFLPAPFVFAANLPCDSTIFAPAVLSGNDDGIPQPFRIQFRDTLPATFALEIFDRWGELVFSSADPNEGWNGRYFNRGNVLASGTYSWKVIYRNQNEKETRQCTGALACESLGLIAQEWPSAESPCDTVIYVPKTLCPNCESWNDVFSPVFTCPPADFHLWIFDRWGNLIFETTDVQQSWDGMTNGNPSMQDNYVWKIKCRFQPGDQPHECVGTVTLIR